ncbi:MAG: DUF1298 domain-containing protein [Acidimicrobiales bacterium]|nr:DUF1298 domain-containing protein [Acidimicrobiales bacterium]
MAEREVDFADRMSDHEALMWNVEKDPWLNPSGGALALLDRPIDMDILRRQIRHGVAHLPRLYQRVVPGLGRLATPVWVPDAEFDLDYHVREIQLPAPGSEEQLRKLAAQLYAEPLDRTRPLWRFVAISGVEGGRGALYVLTHHAISDGIGQLRMAEMYQQLSRDEEPRPEIDLEGIIAAAVAAREPKQLGGDLGENLWATTTQSLGFVARRNLGIVRRAIGQAAIVPADPHRAVDAAQKVSKLASATLAQVGAATGEGASGSPLWAERSRHRHLEYAAVPIDDFKLACRALGGSVNDGFMAALAEAAFRYHDERNVSVDGFNSSFVVSTRTDNKAGGNAFTPVPVRLPARAESFRARIAEVHELLAEAKDRAASGSNIGNLSGLANLLPTSVVTRTARGQAAKLDFVTSNLRGASFPLYIAGAKTLWSAPMGPLAGTPVNVTALSYNGMLDMGLFIDPAAIDDPVAYRDYVQAAFEDLITEADLEPAKKSTNTSKKSTKKSTKKKSAKKKPAAKKKVAAKR